MMERGLTFMILLLVDMFCDPPCLDFVTTPAIGSLESPVKSRFEEEWSGKMMLGTGGPESSGLGSISAGRGLIDRRIMAA